MQRSTTQRSRLLLAGIGLVVLSTGCTATSDQAASPAPEVPTNATVSEPVASAEPSTPIAEPTGSRIQSVAAPSDRSDAQVPDPADPAADPSEPDPTADGPNPMPGSKPALQPDSGIEPLPSAVSTTDLPELACSADSFVLPGLDPSFDASLVVLDTAYDGVESHCSMVDGDGYYYSYTIVGGGLTVADYQEIVDIGDAEITSSVPSGLSYERVDSDYTTVVEVWEADDMLVEMAVIVDADAGARRAHEMIEFLLLFTFDPASF